MSEADYHRLVAAWLRDAFVDVEHEPTLDSGRRPDFIARTPFADYVLEVEDSSGSLYDGLGQAVIYARETGYEPVLVFPADSGVEPGEYGPIMVETV